MEWDLREQNAPVRRVCPVLANKEELYDNAFSLLATQLKPRRHADGCRDAVESG
ncbi:hypothetical protein GGER_20300 [Serratia rubidaea]